MSAGQRRKQQAKVEPEQLIRLEGSSSSSKRSHDDSSSLKDFNKRQKGLSDEIMIGKNHVNPALILHLAKSTKEEGMTKAKINAIISQALRQLKSDKTGSEKAWFMSLVTLAKTKSDLFTSDKITEVLTGYLERDPVQVLHKSRNASLLPVLSWSLLMTAYKKYENWPELFVKLYVCDAISDRVWCENPMCKPTCTDIARVFGTYKPSSITPSGAMLGKMKADTDTIGASGPVSEESSDSSDSMQGCSRYKNSAVLESIQEYVIETVTDYLANKKSVDNMTRNFIRFLCSTCGYQEIRTLAVSKLDAFLSSTKLARPAQDLLSYLACNVRTGSPEDVAVVTKLATLPIKSKPIANFYTACMREVVTVAPANLEHVVRAVIRNELGSSRNPPNMQVMVGLFTAEPDRAAVVLAHVFQELLVTPDDNLRNLRLLLREISRCLQYELRFSQFALALMQEITLPAFKTADQRLQERVFLSLCSLVCLTIMLSCKPSIREIAMSSTKTDLLPLIRFQSEVAEMQKNAVWWLHKVVPAQYRVTGKQYCSALRQVLFMEESTVYSTKDNWPSEAERDTVVSLCAEVPLLENTLMRLGVIGSLNTLPLRPADVLGVINHVVKRAAGLDSDTDVPTPLQITGLTKNSLDVIQMLLRLAEYKNTTAKFPEGYTPPHLVIQSHYWRAWQILLVLAAFNPTTVGTLAWEKHPTLRGLMEMVITNNYQFPPNSVRYQEALLAEKQLAAAEESDILVFEGHLAASRGVKISKANSQLLNQLMVVRENNEGSPMRRPPQPVLEQIRLLAMELHLSHRLCKSREPDFLLDIIKQQGTSASMSWLSELVKSSENSFELLPAPCLCEFLLQDIQNTKRPVLLKRLQSIILGSSDPAQTLEIVSYFTSKLSASYTVRYRAIKGLKTIFNRRAEDTEDGWLLGDLANIPQHDEVKDTVCGELVKALTVEQDASLLGSYLSYICTHCPEGARRGVAVDIARVLVERSHVMFGVVGSGQRVLACLSELMLEYVQGADKGKSGDGCIPLKVGGSGEVRVEREIVQAILVLVTEKNKSPDSALKGSLLRGYVLPKGKANLLTPFAAEISSPALTPRLLDSGIGPLQDLAISALSRDEMLALLQGFSITEVAAEFLLRHLAAASKFKESVEEDESLLVHIRAWNINVPGLEGMKELKSEEDNVAKEEKEMDVDTDVASATPTTDTRDWTDYVREIFEEDSVSSQNHLMMHCLQARNLEEICLTLFVWAQDREIPRKHRPFLAVTVQILAEKCTNADLLEKLHSVLRVKCPELSVKKEEKVGRGVLEGWCEDPSSALFPDVLSALEKLDLTTGGVEAGSTWRRVMKTAIRNNGSHGISLEQLIKLVVKLMVASPATCGLFMDWLGVLSPDLDCVQLFLESSGVAVSLQRYILTMVCSSSGWATIHRCITHFLSSSSPASFDCSLILDFLQGCCNNERIWQGANSQRGTNKGQLRLTFPQLWRLCELVLEETLKSEGDGHKQMILLSWRLPLILSPLHKPLLPELINRLHRSSHRCSKLLTLSLYLSEPVSFHNGSTSATLLDSALSLTDTPTSADALFHQLITNVCDNKKNSASGFILLKRAAARNAPLLLRHLDLLTAALGNPTTATKNEFIQSGYGAVFINIIGILEALGTALFKVVDSALPLLRECLEFVVTHSKHQIRLYAPTIVSLAQILLLFLESDRTAALRLLTPDYLERLERVDGHMRPRDPALSALIEAAKGDSAGGAATAAAAFDETQMAPYLAKLSLASPENLTILQDLDAGSLKKPAVLRMFLGEVCRRMESDHVEYRTLAHRLAIRHVRHAPSDSGVVVGRVVEALQSPYQDVVKSAVTDLPELVLLATGAEGVRLMRAAYKATCASRVDIVPEFMTIIKTVITSSDLF